MNHQFIPLSVPNLKGNELEYVTHAIETEWVSTGGPYVDEFEARMADYVHSKGAISCQNGTSGLHIALQICGIQQDDEVIVPTLTFIAAINPVKYVGAEPVFMDCDHTLTLDVVKLQTFLVQECTFRDGNLINNQTQRLIKAIITVHVFGNMADMAGIMKLAAKYNLKVIEDATEALGTYYTSGPYINKYAGTIGDVGVYSFNGNKIITTGGGGMIISNNQDYLNAAKHLTTQAKSDDLYYTHDAIGYNYRMTNLQAALGLGQMEQLETFIAIKKANYEHYRQVIATIEGLELLPFREDVRPNYWFYALYLKTTYPLNRDALIKYLHSKNIQTRPIWGLISDQKPYEKNQSYQIELAKDYWKHVVNIPCSSNLTKTEVNRVLQALKYPETNRYFSKEAVPFSD
ncbi:LegC family aminotransferase [Acetobacterium wieringae]|uniref:LegC family aminotransferase n=1 Tax=Acetobacterium wieringae TaxID=52694 RepID=A0A5D0WUU5_9FIRM|nr:LegC family aminotransferase [Acetobacterium wieringae]TYC88055.1 LegC family aminotransferase [Acetobacterium wieringae]